MYTALCINHLPGDAAVGDTVHYKHDEQRTKWEVSG